MFYVKFKIEDVTAGIVLRNNNVFCTCPRCGREVAVDIADLFRDGETDLYGTNVYCDECSAAIAEKQRTASPPPVKAPVQAAFDQRSLDELREIVQAAKRLCTLLEKCMPVIVLDPGEKETEET